MDLIEHRDVLGRKAVRPQFETDLPLFKHITNGAISVTTEAWDDEFYLVAMVHGISGVIKPLEDSC